MSLRSYVVVAALVITSLVSQARAADPVIAPKVLVVTMFAGEAKPWLDGEGLTRKIDVPGLFSAFPDVGCSDDGLCMVTTGMGYSHAASSIAALVFGGRFDLTKTYFLISGIGGIDPAQGTLGSAHWARFAVDVGLQNEIDARELPPEWASGYLALFAAAPGIKNAEQDRYGTEVYHLNEELLQAALRVTKDVDLADNDVARANREKYSEPAARAPAQVSICDTLSSDTWWYGAHLAVAMDAYAKVITDGAANPCTTQQEDNATLTALKRGADAHLLDFDRIAILRTGADFDRPPPGASAADTLRFPAELILPAIINAHRVTAKLAHTIVADWTTWSAGPPK